MSSYNWPPIAGSGGGGISTYATLSAFPSASLAGNGAAAIALDTDLLYISNGTSWVLYGAGYSGVTAISIASSNGFSGTSSGGTTPSLTLSTSASGILKGSSGSLVSATAGTDYVIPSGSITGTAANITATSNSTLTTLSALSLPSSQLTGLSTSVASLTAANISATSNSTLTTLSALSLPYSQLTGTPSLAGFATTTLNNLGLTGYLYSNGAGSATASSTIPISALGTESAYSLLGNNSSSAATPSALSSNIQLGTPSVTDTGVSLQTTGTNSSYFQHILQNTNSGTGASADYVVNNNLGTASTYYGDFGMNSSAFTGTGSLNLANAVYLYSQSGDLVLGTNTSNALHLLTNNASTDAITINSSGGVIMPALTGFMYANGSGAITAATTISGSAISGNISGNAANITATSNSTLTTLSALVTASSLNISGSQVTSAVANATSATTATNIAGGAAGSIPLQTGVGATSLLPIGSNTYVLTSNGSTASWQAPSGGLSGLTTNGVAYATSSTAITTTSAGAAGQLLVSNGSSSAPSWQSGVQSTNAPTKQTFLSTGTQTGQMFIVSSANATAGAVYTNNTYTFTVTQTISAGTVLYTSSTGTPTTSGTLTKFSGTGDATITFSSQQALATYTTPTNPAPLYLKIRLVGGGGGGGGTSTYGAGGGGGAGGYVEHLITNPASSYSYSIGAGGTSGYNTNGTSGGTTTFSTLTATGGSGGGSSASSSGPVFGSGQAGGGSASGGNILNTPGAYGGAGIALSSSQDLGAGGGGDTPLGSGGSGGQGSQSGQAGQGYGSGGGGAASNGGGGNVGGSGANGVVIVEEYYGTIGPAVTASVSYAQAYFAGTSSWSTSSTSFTDPTNSGGNTLTVRQSNNITLTAASSSLPGITFTPASANAVYLITASFSTNNNTSNDGVYARLYDGTTEIARSGGSGNTGTSANATYPTMLSGVYVPGTTSAVTVKVQLAAANGGTALITTPYTSANGSAIEWTVQRIDSVAVAGGGGGTVTSVGFSDTSTTPIYTIGSTPVTTSGTITQTLTSQAQNAVFAGPTSGSGQPAFRALVAADIPTGIAITRSISSVSTATNAGSTANTDYVYLVSGTTTITLPTAVGNTNRYTIKNTGSNTVSIATTSSQTIDGSASPITLPVANDSLDLISDSVNWRII